MSALNSVLYLHTITFCLLLHPSRGAEHCDKFVCLCVCLSVCEHISGTAELFLTKFFVQILCGCGSILLCWRYDTLCTSGFIDDVTFGRSGPYGDAWLAALRYRGIIWCLWMPCCYCLSLSLLLPPSSLFDMPAVANIYTHNIQCTVCTPCINKRDLQNFVI